MQPVLPIALSEKNKKTRIILAAIALVVGLVFLAVFFFELLNKPAGWQNIEAHYSAGTCSGDFTFQYDVGCNGENTADQHRWLQNIYTQITADAYKIFNGDECFEGMGNLASLSANPNQVVTVDPALYQCLTQVVSHNDRNIYLANVLPVYQKVFDAVNAIDASRFDPAQNEQIGLYVAQLAAFANDEQSIRIELIGNNQVKLVVSEAYLAFAAENELLRYVDLGWMKNAFIADYMAQRLTEAGAVNGYIASYDGFTRNLDNRGKSYSQNVYDRQGSDVYMPATIGFDRPVSLAVLRDYPLVDMDEYRFAQADAGEFITAYIDPTDGMSKPAISNLLTYSETYGCGEIALQISTVFIADDFSRDTLLTLCGQDMNAVWCEDRIVSYSQKNANISLLENGDQYGYQLLNRVK